MTGFLIFYAITAFILAFLCTLVGFTAKYADREEKTANVFFLASFLSLIWPVALVGFILFGMYLGAKGAFAQIKSIWKSYDKDQS